MSKKLLIKLYDSRKAKHPRTDSNYWTLFTLYMLHFPRQYCATLTRRIGKNIEDLT